MEAWLEATGSPSVASIYWMTQHLTVECLPVYTPGLQVGLASGLGSTTTLHFISLHAISFGDMEPLSCVYSVFFNAH